MNATEKILAFKVGRGGRFNNPGYVTYLGEKNINDFTYDLFLSDENEDENTEWLDGAGNEVGLPLINDGTGTINIDYDYNSIYAIKLSEVTEKEIEAILDDRFVDYDILDDIAINRGFTDLDVKLMNHFKHYEFTLQDDFYMPEGYVDSYYHSSNDEPNDVDDYVYIRGKYYWQA